MGESRIEEIPPEALSATQTAVVTKLVADRGRVPTPFKVWLHSPVLAERLHDLGSYLAGGTSLRKREAKIAILLIATHWRAEYVFKMHAREALDAGLPGEIVDAIAGHREGLDQPRFSDPREQIIYALVRAFTQSAAIDDGIFDEAVHRLGHAGVADLLATCGYFTSVALAMKMYQPA
jgi:4-carboxymuconolactone decarboxylase